MVNVDDIESQFKSRQISSLDFVQVSPSWQSGRWDINSWSCCSSSWKHPRSVPSTVLVMWTGRDLLWSNSTLVCSILAESKVQSAKCHFGPFDFETFWGLVIWRTGNWVSDDQLQNHWSRSNIVINSVNHEKTNEKFVINDKSRKRR